MNANKRKFITNVKHTAAQHLILSDQRAKTDDANKGGSNAVDTPCRAGLNNGTELIA